MRRPRQPGPIRYTPAWFPRLADIIATVEAIDRQQFDREHIGILFDLERTAAANLLADLGADKVAGRYQVSRRELLLKLNKMLKAGHVQDALAREQKRRTHLAEQIEQAKEEQTLRRRPIAVTPTSRWRNLDELDGTHLEPGQITITFESAGQALTRLMELGYAIGNEYEKFERTVTPGAAAPENAEDHAA